MAMTKSRSSNLKSLGQATAKRCRSIDSQQLPFEIKQTSIAENLRSKRKIRQQQPATPNNLELNKRPQIRKEGSWDESSVEAEELETKKYNPRFKPPKPSLMGSIQGFDSSNKAAYKSFQDDSKKKRKLNLYNSIDSRKQPSIKSKAHKKPKEEPSTAELIRSSINEPSKSFPLRNICNETGPLSTKYILISGFLKPKEKGLFAYRLSSGNYGILFPNSSKIVVSQDLFQFYYLRRSLKDGKSQFKASLHNFKKVPACLKSQLKEVYSALQSLCGKKLLHDFSNPESVDESFYLSQNIVYCNRIRQESSAFVFKMSNQILHIIFTDLTEIIFNEKELVSVIITKDSQILKANIGNNFHSYFTLAKNNEELHRKLVFAKEIFQRGNTMSVQKSTKKKYSLYMNPLSKKPTNCSMNLDYKPYPLKHNRKKTTSDVNYRTAREAIQNGAAQEIRKKLASQFYNFSRPGQKRNHPLLKNKSGLGKSSGHSLSNDFNNKALYHSNIS
ncbi:unnamed protein product [Moneuplotes crassus]|uniref:POLO box domain-containing protein n=1 Tax=Euplotes crassus TaxID=5936 RepID=A0AAD1Y2A8_EUPCR|nr:unnamed protein product [Moneuplotes crassus]